MTAPTFTPFMTASGGIKMVAKRAGSCDRCQRSIAIGATIKWYRPTKHRQTGEYVAGYAVHDMCHNQVMA